MEDAGFQVVPDMIEKAGDGDRAPGFEFAKHVLHEFLEMLKCFVGEIYIVDTVDLIMPEFNVIAERMYRESVGTRSPRLYRG